MSENEYEQRRQEVRERVRDAYDWWLERVDVDEGGEHALSPDAVAVTAALLTLVSSLDVDLGYLSENVYNKE